jgi:hypothetical protein
VRSKLLSCASGEWASEDAATVFGDTIVASDRLVAKLYYQIQVKSLSSKCNAIDTILRNDCFEHIEGHAVLRYARTVARVVRFEYPAKPVVHREMLAHTKCQWTVIISGASPSGYVYFSTNAACQLPMI